jgi:N-acetylmuramic acid 6-phosphate etherase
LSWSEENRRRLPPERGDIGALLLYADEPLGALQKAWLDDFDRAGADLVTVVIGHDGNRETAVKQTLARLHRPVPLIAVDLPSARDPLGLDRTLALKMLLNAHSTAVMARLGRTVGNTMTAVQPGNLKLIGRATFLIQSHVNAVLDSAAAGASATATWRRSTMPKPMRCCSKPFASVLRCRCRHKSPKSSWPSSPR